MKKQCLWWVLFLLNISQQSLMVGIITECGGITTLNKRQQLLRENLYYSEFFWSVFSGFQTEYGVIRSISPYSVRMWEIRPEKLRMRTLFKQWIRWTRLAHFRPIFPQFSALILKCLVPTKSSHIPKRTCSFQLQICLSMSEHLMNTKP